MGRGSARRSWRARLLRARAGGLWRRRQLAGDQCRGANPSHEMFSYVVPPLTSENSGAVPASLADYVVAHSEVPSSLARGSLLSVLVGNPLVQTCAGDRAADDGH